ncbi:MAG: hypothetical protein J1F69_00740 [Clostridiales bacterium]|nr:hypothetical protein [Clostridiales bacterium]
MIKKFNTNGAVALYKREFADCLESGNYDGAIDKLIKFSETKHNPDFHSAMGILYFLMTQDSDDRDLLPLAFREFMMHLITHPDSRVTYRNLLAVAILKHDPNSIAGISDFIERRGQNVKELVDELSEFGLDIFNDDSLYIDFDGMFIAADYGEIADEVFFAFDNEQAPLQSSDAQKMPKKPKVIRFKGLTDKKTTPVNGTADKIIQLKNDPIEEKINAGEMFDVMLQLVRGEETIESAGTDELDAEIFSSDDGPADLAAKLALRRAQSMCVEGEYDKALIELDCVDRSTGRLYYCAECVRSNIMMDLNRYDEAQAALDRAFGVLPDGALAGTLQCSLFEITEKYDKIPETLKNIDVADYVDSDHVYRALMFAVKYCTPEDAMGLAEQYIDEFNSFDLRSIHAQMLYNAGDRAGATRELKTLSQIQYDDFNAQYFYLLAKAGVESMPLQDQTPQKVLGMLVDNIIAIVHSELFTESNELIESEPFKYGLEVFLTLEFRHSRNIVRLMFETLNILASDGRLEAQMRNALVSPYIEDLVKAVILGRLLCAHKGKTEFLAERAFCPISSESLPKICESADEGYYMAYALAVMCCQKALPFLAEYYKKIRQPLKNAALSPRDVAYFLWRTVKAKFNINDKDIDERVHFALGYETKTQANSAYKLMSSIITVMTKP